jgi:hypothetical protein
MTNSRPQEPLTLHPEDERDIIIIESLEDLHVAVKVAWRTFRSARPVSLAVPTFPGQKERLKRSLWMEA